MQCLFNIKNIDYCYYHHHYKEREISKNYIYSKIIFNICYENICMSLIIKNIIYVIFLIDNTVKV